MSHHRHRRQVLWSLVTGGGLILTGGVLVRTVEVSTEERQPTTVHGDRLETVPQGGLPSFAQQGSLHVQEVYRYAATHGTVWNISPSGSMDSPHVRGVL
jgi:hypothetical protein